MLYNKFKTQDQNLYSEYYNFRPFKMLQDQDEFCVEPQQQEVRHIHELQLPVSNYEKPFSSQNQNNIALRIVQKPKQIKYLYKRFKFDKQPSSEQEQQSILPLQQKSSAILSLYSREQLVYKKYNNESLSKYKNNQYFSGCFFHHNVFSSLQISESHNICELIKQFYDFNFKQNLPQNKINSSEALIFDSDFESGNLFAAFKVSDNEYDLMMQMDKNSTGNNQWFYFSVSNLDPSKQYTFNVINFTKNDSLFNYGMQPVVYSTIQGQKNKDIQKTWKRMALDVSYKKGTIPRQSYTRKTYYRLSFKIISKFPNDKLFIAHSYPYTFTKLNQFKNQKIKNNKQIIQKICIGKTLSKRSIDCLKITTPSKKKDTRKAIIIMARQHPGQTQGSFVCEGIIQKLLCKSKQSQMLRKNYIFYIIPIVNIDGVVFGHYRTNLAGKDLNRKWDSSQKDFICPQVTCIKKFLAQLSKQRQIRFILDLHGHSKKLNSFFYGNPSDQNPEVVRIYPYICSKISQAIQFQDCTFSSEEYKRKAARVYLSYLYKLLHVYTFQVSFFAYLKDGKKIQFTPKQYRQLGQKLIEGLHVQLQHQLKYQQSFEFNFTKNSTNKEFMNSTFVKSLMELKQNKSLLQLGGQLTSGSQSKPEQGEINDNQITQVLIVPKVTRPASLIMNQETKSVRISRKGQRDVKEVNRPTRNVRLLQISKINSVLPDKFQLCLQPIKNENKYLSQTLKTSISTMMRQNSESQTEKDNSELKLKEVKKAEIELAINLSSSYKINSRPEYLQQKRYSSVIKTQNRNNIIFKIDFGAQETTRQPKNNYPRPTHPTKILKHAFSQTVISFRQNQQKQKIKEQITKQHKSRHNQLSLPLVQTPEEKRWSRNNSLKQDTLRIGNKRQAQIFLNGVVKKYLFEKQQLKEQPLSIFTKVLERPKSIQRKELKK